MKPRATLLGDRRAMPVTAGAGRGAAGSRAVGLLLAWAPGLAQAAAASPTARSPWRDAVMVLGLVLLVAGFLAVLVTTWQYRRARRGGGEPVFHRHGIVEMVWLLVPWLAVVAIAAGVAWLAWS